MCGKDVWSLKRTPEDSPMKELLKQFKGITRLFTSGHHESTKVTHPARDWHLLLVLTFVLFVGLTAFSLATFYRSTEGGVQALATSTKATILRQQDLRSALELYQKRLTVLETLRRETGSVLSPGSLPDAPTVEVGGIETPAFD